jgi:predicted metal-dependent hydrolase
MSTFLENCHDSAKFRLSVKRTRPKTLQDAITAAIQEECLRQTEHEKHRDNYKSGRVLHLERYRERPRRGNMTSTSRSSNRRQANYSNQKDQKESLSQQDSKNVSGN